MVANNEKPSPSGAPSEKEEMFSPIEMLDEAADAKAERARMDAESDKEMEDAKDAREAMDAEDLEAEIATAMENKNRVFIKRDDGESVSARIVGRFDSKAGSKDVMVAFRENGILKTIAMTPEEFYSEQQAAGLERESQPETVTERGERALELLEEKAPNIFNTITKSKWLLAGRAGGFLTKGLGVASAAWETAPAVFLRDTLGPAAQDLQSAARLADLAAPEQTIDMGSGEKEKPNDQRGYIGTALTTLWGAPDTVLKAIKKSEEYNSTVAKAQFDLGAVDYRGVTGREKTMFESVSDKMKDAGRYFFSPFELSGTEILLPLVKDNAEMITTLQRQIEQTANSSAALEAKRELGGAFEDLEESVEEMRAGKELYDDAMKEANAQLEKALHASQEKKLERALAGKMVEHEDAHEPMVKERKMLTPIELKREERAKLSKKRTVDQAGKAAQLAELDRQITELEKDVPEEGVLMDDGQDSEEMVRTKETYEPAVLLLPEDEVADRRVENMKIELAKKVGELAKAKTEKPARRTVFDTRKKNLERLQKDIENLTAKIENERQTKKEFAAAFKEYKLTRQYLNDLNGLTVMAEEDALNKKAGTNSEETESQQKAA
jgi:hypothetical protein